jgi:hypothetical protein
MTGAYEHRDEYPEVFRQTELNMNVKLDPPYDGLFFCFQRQSFFRWPEYISYYRNASKLNRGLKA